MEIIVMSALKLASAAHDRSTVNPAALALDARTLRSRAFAAFAAGAIVAAYDAAAGLVARMRAWNERRVTFAELERLDDRILADIGLSRGEIDQVAAGHYVRDGQEFRKNATGTRRDAANQDRNRNAA
jgi:uncharacterized protein YjiS (DUF1127 family)